MSLETEVTGLVGKNLKDFHIEWMAEVYRVDTDGRKSASFGFFKDPNIATAFVGVQKDSEYHRTGQVLVLTDGTVGYVIEKQVTAKLFDDHAEALEIKKKVLGKLSPAERKLLGFEVK